MSVHNNINTFCVHRFFHGLSTWQNIAQDRKKMRQLKAVNYCLLSEEWKAHQFFDVFFNGYWSSTFATIHLLTKSYLLLPTDSSFKHICEDYIPLHTILISSYDMSLIIEYWFYHFSCCLQMVTNLLVSF